MAQELLLLLVGLAYALIFRLLAWVRREGFSAQFILEAVLLTLVAAGLSFLAGIRLDPILFVLLVYLVTMRARLLVDVANLVARSGRFGPAERFYGLAWRLGPDAVGRQVIATNQGAALILEGRVAEAIPLLEGVLEAPHLPPKYAAAAHYNLGVAYRSQGETRKSKEHLHAAIEALPGSIYARRAQALLRKRAGRNADKRR
ncbi:MAG TPA: tetratricopeptide repeat protein [Anaerolineales bacterium]|nr:tetratricopeptide repeat protein [Anaerolineales bacterium]